MTLTYQGKVLDSALVVSVMAFLAVFVASVAVTTLILSALGLDIVTAYTAA